MKTFIKIFSLLFISSVVFYSCNDEDLDVVDNAAGYSEGGLIRNDNPLVNYVIGSDQDYTFSMLIYQGAIKTTRAAVGITHVARKVSPIKPASTANPPKMVRLTAWKENRLAPAGPSRIVPV